MCAGGTYYTGHGAPAGSTCAVCSAGSYSTSLGANSSDTCAICSAGTYNTGEGVLTYTDRKRNGSHKPDQTLLSL